VCFDISTNRTDKRHRIVFVQSCDRLIVRPTDNVTYLLRMTLHYTGRSRSSRRLVANLSGLAGVMKCYHKALSNEVACDICGLELTRGHSNLAKATSNLMTPFDE